MKCAIVGCNERADPDGGVLCKKKHQAWTAALMRRCLKAIETAITDEDGLDGREGEAILRDAGYWPKRSDLIDPRTPPVEQP
jgi:hypothetical protein